MEKTPLIRAVMCAVELQLDGIFVLKLANNLRWMNWGLGSVHTLNLSSI